MSAPDAHALSIARSVWGRSTVIGVGDSSRASLRYAPAPDRAKAHQLLPMTPAAVVAAAGRPSDDRPIRRRARDGVGTAALLASGLIRPARTLRFGDLDATLTDALRQAWSAPVHALVVLNGPPRANQKPVIQAIDRLGRTLGYAKLAWNPLTEALLAHERQALEVVNNGGVKSLRVPGVVGSGSHDGVGWLALSPVRIARPKRGIARLGPLDAADVISTISGVEIAPLNQMTLAVSLASRAAGLPLAAPAIDALLTAHGSTVMTAGAWHGDFVPWNVRSGGGEIGVWDWERFATGVPLGFDRLHFDAQVAVHRRGMAIPAALASLTANSSQLLPGLDDGARSATVAAYLTELLVRYESDSIGTDNPALTAWCTHLADALTRPEVLQ